MNPVRTGILAETEGFGFSDVHNRSDYLDNQIMNPRWHILLQEYIFDVTTGISRVHAKQCPPINFTKDHGSVLRNVKEWFPDAWVIDVPINTVGDSTVFQTICLVTA